MSGDGSFPHQRPTSPDEPDEPPEAEPEGARVFEFPSEELPTSPPVPAGTWADESTERTSSVDRLLKPAGVADWKGGGEVVEFPRQSVTRRRRKSPPPLEPAPEDVSGTQAVHAPTETGAEVEEPVRPKFLASELLERDWTPPHPLRRTLRTGAAILGGLGAVGAPVVGGLSVESLGLGVLFALCAAAGLAPLAPSARGVALAALGAGGAAWVAWLSHVAASSAGTGLLVGCVVLTTSALFFRAAHNRSRLARALVSVGLLATAVWLGLTGGVDALVVESLEWQAWVGPSSRLLLAAIAVLSLLTFLDPSAPGGAWVAGFALLAWLVVATGGELLLMLIPTRGEALDPGAVGWTARAALPAFAAVAAGGLSQVWVTLSIRLARR